MVGGARNTRSPGQSRGPVELLADLVRSVRLAAAREILDTPVARLPQAIAGDLRAAMADRQAAFANRLDFPRHICSWEAWR